MAAMMKGLLTDRRTLFERGDILDDSFLKRFKCLSHDEVFLYAENQSPHSPIPSFSCKFNSDGLHGNLLAMVDEEGYVRLMDTRKPATVSLIKEWRAHENAVFDFAFTSNNSLVTGSGDTMLIQWDIEMGVAVRKFKGHTGTVKSIDIDQSNPCVIVSGGREGSILLWDNRCTTNKDGYHKPVIKITNSHFNRQHTLKSPKSLKITQVAVTTVLFHHEHFIASSGAADGTVKLWDMRNMSVVSPKSCHSFSSGCHGVTSLISDPYHTTLYASCTDNRIYAYDSVRLKPFPIYTLSGHYNSTFYVKSAISPCGRFLLSGSSCGNAHIWDTQNPDSPPTLLIGHTKEVTAVAWSPYQLDTIVTCSDACDFRIWRALIDKKRQQEEQLVGYAERSSISINNNNTPVATINHEERTILSSIENILPITPPISTATPITTTPTSTTPKRSSHVIKKRRKSTSASNSKLSTPKRARTLSTNPKLVRTLQQQTLTSFYSCPKLVK